MMDSGRTQKLIELHLQKVGMSPRSKRVQVFNREVEYLSKLISENGAVSMKVLKTRLLSTAIEAGIDGKEAMAIIDTAQRWAKMQEEISQSTAPTTTQKEERR